LKKRATMYDDGLEQEPVFRAVEWGGKRGAEEELW
jgi:hypothetical protein